MIFATAGHVDHGKTTLIKALTGVDTDRLKEEKKRGLTIEPGYAYIDLNGERLGFVDVPGHHRFIRNMLAGVGAIEAALLIIAADDGVMPQTTEHAHILKLLNVRTGIAVITKADLVDEQRLATVRQQAADLATEVFSEDCDIVVSSADTGLGLDSLRSAIDKRVQRHKQRKNPTEVAALRMNIDRVFTLKGVGLTVTGTIINGQLRSQDQVIVQPGNHTARVRGLRVMDQARDEADAGVRCAVNLSGINREQLERGAWLLAPSQSHTSSDIDVAMHKLVQKRIPMRGHRVHFHSGASHTLAQLIPLQTGGKADANTQTHESVDLAYYRLKLDEPLPLRFADRFIVRDLGNQHTIGGGNVVDSFPPNRHRRSEPRLHLLQTLNQESSASVLQSMAEIHDQAMTSSEANPALIQFDPKRWSAGRGIDDSSLTQLLDDAELIAYQRTAQRSTNPDASQWRLLNKPGAELLQNKVLESVAGWHKANPQLTGIRPQQLRGLLSGSSDLLKPAIDHCIYELLAAGALKQLATSYALPDHQPSLPKREQQAWDKIRPLLEGELKPPVIREISQKTGIPQRELEKLLGRLAHMGLVMRVSENRFFSTSQVEELLRQVQAVAQAHPEGHITPISFRDASGIGRNLAIEVLEFFDSKGVTRRHGDYRLLFNLERLHRSS